MKSNEQVISQAIADFDAIEKSIVECGVEVPKGTDTCEYPDKIKEIYNAGENAGKQAAYDEFWDLYQDNGNRVDYERMFSGDGWEEKTFKPKYSIQPTNANAMFSHSNITDLQALLDECGITVDFSKVTYNRLTQPFMASVITRVGTIDLSSLTNATYVFYQAMSLETIEKLIFAETNVFVSNWFQSCSALANINEVEGVISNSISFNWSPLTPTSMKNIIACLKNYAETDKANTYTVKFTDACWTALEADSTAPDGKPWKEYVEYSLGWNT